MRRNLQKPVARQGPVRVLREDFQQIELARGQALFTAVIRVDQDAPIEIEHPPADAHAWALGRRSGGPAQLGSESEPHRSGCTGSSTMTSIGRG